MIIIKLRNGASYKYPGNVELTENYNIIYVNCRYNLNKIDIKIDDFFYLVDIKSITGR